MKKDPLVHHMKRKKEHSYIGSSLDDFLKEEGILEHCEEVGAKYAFSMQLKDEMERQAVILPAVTI